MANRNAPRRECIRPVGIGAITTANDSSVQEIPFPGGYTKGGNVHVHTGECGGSQGSRTHQRHTSPKNFRVKSRALEGGDVLAEKAVNRLAALRTYIPSLQELLRLLGSVVAQRHDRVYTHRPQCWQDAGGESDRKHGALDGGERDEVEGPHLIEL